ncbi:hypothetical protein MOP88_20175 [Sphingomonas sp. WKB10]|nr:hypothetical protein [Sphingomonas sp. WKB10]
MPVRADRDARCLRLDPGTEAGGVAEPDRRGFDIPPARPSEDMDVVVDAATDDEPASIRAPCDAAIAVGDGQRLHPPAAMPVDRVAEDVLDGLRRDDLPVGPVEAIEAAGQHQHFAPVRTARDRRRAIDDIGGVGTSARDQRLEPRAGRCGGGKALSGRQGLPGPLLRSAGADNRIAKADRYGRMVISEIGDHKTGM